MKIEKLAFHDRIDPLDLVKTGTEPPSHREMMDKINEIIDALNIRGIGQTNIGIYDPRDDNTTGAKHDPETK